MTSPAVPAAPPRDPFLRDPRFVAFVGLATLVTIGVVLSGNVVLVSLLFLAGTGAVVVAKAPLRWSASALVFAMLTFEDSGENAGQWHSPLVIVGDVLHGRIDAVLGIPGLAVSGMEIAIVLLLLVWGERRSRGITLDVRGQVPSASIVRYFLVLYVAGVAWSLGWGLLNGGEMAPWKLRNLLHPLALYALLRVAYRGPEDHGTIARIVVAAAMIRSVLAGIVQHIARVDTGGELNTATNHGDSVLFGVAIFLVLADLMERASPRRFLRAGLVLPVIFYGCVENNRRIVWVLILMMLVAAYLLSPKKAWSRLLTRAVAVALPALVLYVAVGWDREGSIFKPVHMLRSVSDSSMDGSAHWREIENYNIAMSIQERPILGIGLGQRYTQHMWNTDISSVYKEYREWPHNTILGLLLFMGFFAFTAMWSVYVLVAYLAVKIYWTATDPEHRIAALGCIAALIACHVLAYGDTGAHYAQYKIFMAFALTVTAKLSVVTGAWPSSWRPPGSRDEVVVEVAPPPA